MSISPAELSARWARVEPSPAACGRVIQVCVRPELDGRVFPEALELDPVRGATGDRWERRTWMYLPDGRPDPRVQVAVMNCRMLEFLRSMTGCEHHPGDTLIVDLDLTEANLPVGTRLRAGTATIEVSDVENDGCAKFARYFGEDVLRWMRDPANRPLRLRGLFAQVVSAGRIRVGDDVRVLPPAELESV